MKLMLVGMSIYGQVSVTPPVIEDQIAIQCFGCWQSPYVYRDSRPYWRRGAGFWGPQWQRNPYWVYRRYRQGW